jgi:hypothetical protein
MMIRVIYQNGKYDMVMGFMLDQLIKNYGIRAFKRSNGWVAPGVDPIRAPGEGDGFAGEDRRTADFPFHHHKEHSVQ